MNENSDALSSLMRSDYSSILDQGSDNSSIVLFSFKQRRQIQEAKSNKSQRQQKLEGARWPVYLKFMVQAIAAGTIVANAIHFGYTDAVPVGYDLIADTLRTIFTVSFWIFINPFLCATVGECKSIAAVQFFRIIIAFATIVSEVYQNSPLVSITSGVFISLEPVFPMVIPILARISQRDVQILMFGSLVSLGAISSGSMLMIYHNFGPISGLVVEVCVLFCAFISAVSMKEEDIDFEFHDDSFQRKSRESLSQTYLWCCVFPVGATTTFVGFDACQLWGRGNAKPGWTYKEVDWVLGNCCFFISLTVIIATLYLHYQIPPQGKSRLHELIWWSSYYMIIALCAQIIMIIVKKIFGVTHFLFFIMVGITSGLFCATPDIVLIVETSFGADDFASLCILFEILHNLFSWLCLCTFRVLILLGVASNLTFTITILGGFLILVTPFVFVVINLAYDPTYIYITEDGRASEIAEESPRYQADTMGDSEHEILNKAEGRESANCRDEKSQCEKVYSLE